MMIAGTYLRHGDQILILHRGPQIAEGNRWCLPGGKIEPGETPIKAAIRETWEEAGILLASEELNSFGVLELDKAGLKVIFHIFHADLNHKPVVRLAEREIQGAKWLTHEEILKLPLIGGGPTVLNYCKGML